MLSIIQGQRDIAARARDANRELVANNYEGAEKKNRVAFIAGRASAGEAYIYPNQKEDAINITTMFFRDNIRAVSIIKRTKVGMDGLMIQLATNMTTHPDDGFVLKPENVLFITGMSNAAWETDMKEKTPECFRNSIFHHGKLHQKKLKTKLLGLQHALIILDEIDSGDNEDGKLHRALYSSGILDIEYMENNNIRFVFVSATMKKELLEMSKWGDARHRIYHMSIPAEYIGPKDFLAMGIIQDYYALHTDQLACKWVREDIVDNYGNNHRVHLVRTTERYVGHISAACTEYGVVFRNHTSTSRIPEEELTRIFSTLTGHVVIAVKGFYRRANLICNEWKLKIGATHEMYVNTTDTSVQVQGFPGRMSGYWRSHIESGHKTGPHRTSSGAINEYEKFYANPLGDDKYSSSTKPLFMAPRNIKGILTDGCGAASIPTRLSNMHVPIVIDVAADSEIFSIKHTSDRVAWVKQRIQNDPEYQMLFRFISDPRVECSKTTQPVDKNSVSYKCHILDVVDARNRAQPYIRDLPKSKRGANNWQLFVDQHEHRLCILLWTVGDILK